MQVVCPKCGVRETRISHHRTLGELMKGWIGIYYIRCRRCQHRWNTSVWTLTDWKYARCPRCYRHELSTWSLQHYNPPWTTRAILRIGATPYRCAACRCNFASFLPCRERFPLRHEHPTADSVSEGPHAKA